MKTDINEITINGKTYVEKGSAFLPEPSGDLKIVVLQRGWVLVGKLEEIGTLRKLHKASVIRNWGTTKGLGELAKNGPQTNTKLDPCNGVVEFDVLTMVLSISIEESAWKNAL